MAYNQGVGEANKAADQMQTVGFQSGSIIYFDFERPNPPSTDSSVQAFVSGWVSQLHARGQNAGIYGSYQSAMVWQGAGVVQPDAIWFYEIPGLPTVDPFCGSSPCIPETLWNNHQRIHQYTQDPTGATVDHDFADGPVAIYPIGTITINVTLDGSPWPNASSGALSWSLTGPSPATGSGVPMTLYAEIPGVYSLFFNSGGPTGGAPVSISLAGSQTLMPKGSLTFTFNFVSGGVCRATNGFTIGAACAPPPTVTLSANPTTVSAGGSSTLTWNSTNASACVASGAWSGSQPTSGSQSVTPGGTTAYSLTCSGTGGSASQSVTISVSGSQAPPAVYLAAFPQTVSPGTAVGLGWATSNASSCTATGGWSGAQALTGGTTVYPVTTTSYTLSCSGPGGSANASVTVVVASATPSVSLAASPPAIASGGTATLQWSTNGMISCAAAGGWSGSKALNGSQQVSPSATTTYTLNCSASAPPSQQLVRNGSFSGIVTEWSLSTDFFANSNFGSCNLTCPGYAYLADPNSGSLSASNNLFGTMSQDIALPGTASSIALSYWVSISTLENGTLANDVLSVWLYNTQNSPLALLRTFSNLDAGGYRQLSFDWTCPGSVDSRRLGFDVASVGSSFLPDQRVYGT